MIRAATMADCAAMLNIYRPFVETTAVSFEYEPPTEEEFARRMQEHMQDYPWLVWEEDGEVLGYAYAGRLLVRAAYSWIAEISCYLDERIRRRGIGTMLYTEVERILTEMGCRQVYALITGANAPSIAFHKAIGYEEVGQFPLSGYKFDTWYSVSWLMKQLQAPGHPAEFPKNWRKI